ncbi:hypothetical protein O3M35_009818 [Rhynocoris fuscipes]|uniref:Uncharacterized protein n=1 Tax=Rhynocoris fuscipes TaxID=488301 RepID=A0AAW1DBV5_9HEMI
MSLKKWSSGTYSADGDSFFDDRSSSVKYLAPPKMFDRNRSKSWDSTINEEIFRQRKAFIDKFHVQISKQL